MSKKQEQRLSLHQEDLVEMVDLTNTSSANEIVHLSTISSPPPLLEMHKHLELHNSLQTMDTSCQWEDASDIPNGKWADRCCIESHPSCLRSMFCCECTYCCQPCRRCVSTNKVRWEKEGKYSKRRRSNVAVIIVGILFINSFLYYCLLSNHSFQTNPNKITNCFKLILLCYNFTNYIAPAFAILIFEQVSVST
jgi:hypothetical protein